MQMTHLRHRETCPPSQYHATSVDLDRPPLHAPVPSYSCAPRRRDGAGDQRTLVGGAAPPAFTNSFLSSSTGRETLREGDTIQFEVTVTVDTGRNYDTILWSLTGDVQVARWWGCCADYPDPSNRVTDWAWHYTPTGGGLVDMGTTGRIAPAPRVALPPPRLVVGAPGIPGVAGKSRDGVPSLVGTVTIEAGDFGWEVQTTGSFRARAFQLSGVDAFCGSSGCEEVTVTGGEFTVVPEPGSLTLLLAGLTGMAASRRRTRQYAVFQPSSHSTAISKGLVSIRSAYLRSNT